MQDKTQIIPFSKTDFVHTRLTHSLEDLGEEVWVEWQVKIFRETQSFIQRFNIKSMISAPLLLLRHYSMILEINLRPQRRKAARHYFINGNGAKYKSKLSDKEYQDLCKFEGNANGFKILTESKLESLRFAV